jgi:hypothetical protein
VSRVGESSGQRDERLHVAPGIQRQDQKFHRSPRSSW